MPLDARRLVVMAHFDPDGLVAPHVRRQIQAWLATPVDLTVVSTAELNAADRDWLNAHVQLIQRPNEGYDFLSYRAGLEAAGDLSQYDEVIVCNDSFVGPLRSYAEILQEMGRLDCDFWGFTRSDRNKRHVQSYFIAFRPSVVGSDVFREFWAGVSSLANRRAVIRRYEVGLSVKLVKAGFRMARYFVETRAERYRGRLRVAWWVLHRQAKVEPISALARFRRDGREPWNPTYGLADSALHEARLPVVKLDTLRHDPYGLDAERLLRLCEDRYSAEFEGVRAFLERTASRYPTRKGEALRPTPWWLRPLRPFVAYRA